DARFFLLEVPAGQVGEHDRRETTMSFWATPGDVLARAERGEIFLAPPTSRTLELLAEVGSVREATALAEGLSLAPVCPRFVAAGPDGAPFLALPGDPEHELSERVVPGPTRYVWRGERFVSEEAPPADAHGPRGA